MSVQHGDYVNCDIIQLLCQVKACIEILLKILVIRILLLYLHLFVDNTCFKTSNASKKVILTIHAPMSLLEKWYMLRLML